MADIANFANTINITGENKPEIAREACSFYNFKQVFAGDGRKAGISIRSIEISDLRQGHSFGFNRMNLMHIIKIKI